VPAAAGAFLPAVVASATYGHRRMLGCWCKGLLFGQASFPHNPPMHGRWNVNHAVGPMTLGPTQ
jgi:hypothetical protein